MRDNVSVKFWKLLNFSTVLPPNAGHHAHCWQIIDSGIAGCKLCGVLHVCGDNCSETEEVHDGVVCKITGCYVHDKRYVLEWSDNVHIDDENRIAIPAVVEDRNDDIETAIKYILLSKAAKNAFVRDRKRWHAARQLAIQHQSSNIVEKVCSCANLRQPGLLEFDVRMREELTSYLTKLLNHVLSVAIRILRLSVKDNEFFGFVVGVMYLMKSGVFISGHVVLPTLQFMQYVLPSESSLSLLREIRAKNITDAENRLKYVLRGVTYEFLLQQGLNIQPFVAGARRFDEHFCCQSNFRM